MTQQRAAIYCRVSTTEQAEKQTITVQVDACREFCEKQGWDVVGEYLDDGVSGVKPFDERPAGKELLTALPEVDHVVLYCVDRLSRDNATGIPVYNKLVKATGGSVHFVLQSFDDSPEGRFQFTIFMGIADYERGVIKRRTMGGIVKKVKAGEMYRASVAPYGYRYDPETKQLTVREDQAAVVRTIYDLYLKEGIGPKAIVSRLEDAGIQTPAASGETKRENKMGWATSRVRHFLVSPVYKGEGKYRAKDPNKLSGGKPEVIEMPCPAIIDEETWDLVQRRMKSRGIDGPKTKRNYLLARLLWCSDCGSMYSPYSGRGHKAAYRCNRRTLYNKKRSIMAAHEGKRWNWPASILDNVVKGFVRNFMSDPERLAPYIDAGLVKRQQEVKEQRGGVEKLERRLAALEAQETSFLELKDNEQMIRLLNSNHEEQNEVSKALSTARRRSLTVEDTYAALTELRNDLALLTAQAKEGREKFGQVVHVDWVEPKTEEEWKQLVRHLITKVWITGADKKLSVKFEGVLHYESVADPSDVIGASRPQSRGRYNNGDSRVSWACSVTEEVS
ncbi:hypothetical protein LCGC14_1720680 [marine sediment metagenome]|uniref:Recombinase domain-containing protein n=1 Tax=marine sediment metagenome TaxID=412755 RepID=A0A0F9I0B0_9ZZZZ